MDSEQTEYIFCTLLEMGFEFDQINSIIDSCENVDHAIALMVSSQAT